MRQYFDNILNTKYLAYLSFIVLLTSCNFGIQSIGDKKETEVSILRLTILDNKYSDIKIRTTAYVNIDKGELVAYPSRDSYIARDDLASIKLEFSFKEATNLSKIYKDHYCVISGILVYEKNKKFLDKKRLGKLVDPQIISISDFTRSDDRGSNEVMLKIVPYQARRDPRVKGE